MTRIEGRAITQRRVVLIGPGPTTRGGIAQFNTHLAEALARAGADVRLLVLSPVYPSWTKPGRQAPVSVDALPPNIEVCPVRLVAWRPRTWPRAIRELARERPLAVVFQWWHPMFGLAYALLAGAARRLGAHVLFVCHNAEPHERFPLGRPLTSLALKEADSLLVLSDAVGEALETHFPKKRVVRLRHPPYDAFLQRARPGAHRRKRQTRGSLLRQRETI
jgi:glycosyltransferase involved in cell wall biosynthesis